MRLLKFFLLLASWIPVVACTQPQPVHPEGVETSYDIDPRKPTLHEPITLTFSITNLRPGKIGLDLGQNKSNGFSFKLTRPDGSLVDSPAFEQEGISEIGTMELQPRESFSKQLLLNKRFEFPVPGRYLLTGYLTPQMSDENGKRIGNDSGLLKIIDVGPRDETRLVKVCENLSQRIAKARSYNDSVELATQLSYVSDPVAVRFLSQALQIPLQI